MMNFQIKIIVLLVVSAFLLSSCEVYNTLYGTAPAKQPTTAMEVARVEAEQAKDASILAKNLYASSELASHDMFKSGSNPLGPFPGGKPLGFTLQQWLSASGIGIYSVNNINSSLELSFKNLVPNGIYTILCSRITMPPNYSVEEKPCGAEDGSQNVFTSDSKGIGTFSLSLSPLEASTEETATLIEVVYHSDGKTYGALPGDFGLNSHVQILFVMPPTGNETKFEVPIKFVHYGDAGLPEQDVFIEKEKAAEKVPEEKQEYQNKTEEVKEKQPEAKPAPTGAATHVVPQEQPSAAEEKPKENPIVINVQETDFVNLVPKVTNPDKEVEIALTYTSPLNASGQWQTTYGDAGQYTITVTASNGQMTTSRDVLLIVNKKEEAPTIDASKPIETGITIDEGQSVDFSITASDLNKDALSYNWKLDSVDVSNDTSFLYQTDYGNAGVHTVKVEVSDGVLSASKIWSVDVKHVNRAPVLEMVNDVDAKETDKIIVTAFATDPDNDALTYSISDSRFKQDNNVFTWQTDYGSHGVYNVTITVSDGQLTASRTFRVSVQKVYRPPVIVDIVQQK